MHGSGWFWGPRGRAEGGGAGAGPEKPRGSDPARPPLQSQGSPFWGFPPLPLYRMVPGANLLPPLKRGAPSIAAEEGVGVAPLLDKMRLFPGTRRETRGFLETSLGTRGGHSSDTPRGSFDPPSESRRRCSLQLQARERSWHVGSGAGGPKAPASSETNQQNSQPAGCEGR